METKKDKRGNGLIKPQLEKKENKPMVKRISTKNDGLMERKDTTIITEDGKQLLI